MPGVACHGAMILLQVPVELAAAARSYLAAFGHPVPGDALEMFVTRPGPLQLDIRQAVALMRPVKGWLARSQTRSVNSIGPA